MQKDMNAPYASVLISLHPLDHNLIPRIWLRLLKKPSLLLQKASSVRLRLRCFRNLRNGVMERLLGNFKGEENHYPETNLLDKLAESNRIGVFLDTTSPTRQYSE